MKVNVLSAMFLGVLASALMAQDAEEGRGPRRGRGPGRMLDNLPETLELDEAQLAQFDEITAEFRERRRVVRDLGRELRRAQRDGDDARAAELQQQLTEAAFDPRELLKQTLDRVEPILNDDQISRFSEFRQEMEQRWERRQERGGPGGRGFPGGPWGRGPGRMLDRFVEPLELDEQQRAELEEIMAEHRERMQDVRPLMREMREARRNGDTKKTEELRAQMFELGVDPWESLQQALDEVEPILTDEQFDRFSNMRMDFQDRRERRETFRRFRDELPDAVNMSEQQRQEFDELVRSGRGGWRQFADRMRDIQREMSEAREAGDEARIEELQAELDAMRPDPEGTQAELAKAVRGMLTEDQLPLFDAYYESMGTDQAGLPDDVRSLVRAAARSRLDRAQRKEWRVIMRDAVKSLRGIDHKDEDARTKLAAETRKKIEAMLKPDQTERFEKELDRLKQSRKRASTRT